MRVQLLELTFPVFNHRSGNPEVMRAFLSDFGIPIAVGLIAVIVLLAASYVTFREGGWGPPWLEQFVRTGVPGMICFLGLCLAYLGYLLIEHLAPRTGTVGVPLPIMIVVGVFLIALVGALVWILLRMFTAQEDLSYRENLNLPIHPPRRPPDTIAHEADAASRSGRTGESQSSS